MARLNIKLPDDMKKNASDLYKKMGMTLSTAVKVFLQESINDQRMPFTPSNTGSQTEYYIKTPKGLVPLAEYLKTTPLATSGEVLKKILSVKSNLEHLKHWSRDNLTMELRKYHDKFDSHKRAGLSSKDFKAWAKKDVLNDIFMNALALGDNDKDFEAVTLEDVASYCVTAKELGCSQKAIHEACP